MVLSTDQINQTKRADQAKETDNAAVMRELQKIADLKKMQQNMDMNTYENIISDAKRVETLRGEKAYQAKLQKDPGIKVLSNLAKDLAALGIDLTPKMDKKSLNSKITDELEQISQSLLKGDKLDLTKDAVRKMQNRQEKQQEERSGDQSRQSDIRMLLKASDVKEAVQKYSAAYAEETLLSDPEAKDKLRDAQETLKQKGFSEKDIETLDKSVERSLKTDFLSKMQENFIRQVITPKDAFQMVAKSEDQVFAKQNEQSGNQNASKVHDDLVQQMITSQMVAKSEGQIFAKQDEQIAARSDEQNGNLDASKVHDDLIQQVIASKNAFQLVSKSEDQVAARSDDQDERLNMLEQTIKEDVVKTKDVIPQKEVFTIKVGEEKQQEKALQSDLREKKAGNEKSENTYSSFSAKETSPQNTQHSAQYIIAASPEIRRKLDEARDEQLHEDNNKTGRVERKGEKHHEGEDRSSVRNLNDAKEMREAVQQFSSVFAQFAAAASPEAREKLEDAKDNLKKKGVSDQDIRSIEKAVKGSLKSGYVSDIQDSFTNHMFSSKKSFQFVVTSKQLNNAYEEAVKAQQLTGISADPESVKEQMANIARVSHQEIKDFVKEAVESRLMERHLSGKDNRMEVKKLVDLGHKVGFNFNAFLKTWEQKKFDLGLFVLEAQNAEMAQDPNKISIGEVSAGGVNDKHGYEMTKDEERELLINQLRAEMMKRALTGDPFAVFSFSPKIRKLKNGLIKLGLETEDFMKIEKEAKALARYRTLEMLKGSFIERSTYYELSGPAYGLLKNKIKGLVSNLGNLDMAISKEELDYLRDDANRMMHDHAIIELKSAVSILENHEHPSLEKKVPMMVKLIQRLKEESGFSHGVGEDIEEVVYRHQNNQKAVKESA